MQYIFGNKNQIQVNIESVTPHGWDSDNFYVRSCIWLNNQRVGKWNDINYIAQLLNSLCRIAINYEGFYLDNFEKLSCNDIFKIISSDNYLANSKEVTYWNNFHLDFGENFDYWHLWAVYKDGKVKFIWKKIRKKYADKAITKNFNCIDIELKELQNIVKSVLEIVPKKFWPYPLQSLQHKSSN